MILTLFLTLSSPCAPLGGEVTTCSDAIYSWPTQPLGTEISYAAFGDVDGDGDTDTLTSYWAVPEFKVWLDDGTGHYAETQTVLATKAPNLMHLADLDGDGDLDICAGVSQETYVELFENNGSGSFTSMGTVTMPGRPKSIDTGDVDGDGDLDIIVAMSYDLGLVVLNNHDGAYSAGQVLDLTVYNRGIALEYLDADEHLDLLVGLRDTGVAAYLNSGDGTLAFNSIVLDDPEIGSFQTEDMNGDGQPDLILSTLVAGEVVANIALNAGELSFNVISTTPCDGYYRVLADFDGDGDIDLAVLYESFELLLNDGSGVMTSVFRHRVRATYSYIWRPAAVDTDHDGRIDLVAQAGNGIIHLRQRPEGGFRTPVAAEMAGRAIHFTQADMNGDGIPDVVAACTSNGIQIMLGDGHSLAAGQAYDHGLGHEYIYHATGDVDGDGDLDVVAIADQEVGFRILLNNGDGTLAPSTYHKFGYALKQPIHLADMDGDGRLDVIASFSAFQQSGIRVIRNLGDGFFGFLLSFPAIAESTGFRLQTALGDLDNDGDVDAVVRSDDHVTFLFNDGTGEQFESTVPVPASSGTGMFITDLNLDCQKDVVVTTGDGLLQLMNEGNGSFVPQLLTGLPEQVTHLVDGDFDNDGWPDAAVATYHGGLHLYLNRLDGAFEEQTYASVNGPVLALDTNEDHRTDLAMWTSTGLVQLYLSDTCDFGCPGDVDDNGAVGFPDILAVLAEWNTASCGSTDVDGNGVVGFGDLLLILAEWGTCN